MIHSLEFLFVSMIQLNVISNLYLSFKKVIQDSSCSITKKNFSHTVIKAEYFQTEFILGSIFQVKLIKVITSLKMLYTHIVKLITIQSYLQT